MKTDNKIFLDMDGVLVNLVESVREVLGIVWGDVPNNEMWRRMREDCPDIFLEARPMDDAVDLVGGVVAFAEKHGYTIEILTAVPTAIRFPKTTEHKQQWVDKYFGKHNFKFNVGPTAIEKQKHAKMGDILIDDNVLNIRQWNAVGGHGIFHESAQESLKRLHVAPYRRMKQFYT